MRGVESDDVEGSLEFAHLQLDSGFLYLFYQMKLKPQIVDIK